jgi:hypothetical protein
MRCLDKRVWGDFGRGGDQGGCRCNQAMRQSGMQQSGDPFDRRERAVGSMGVRSMCEMREHTCESGVAALWIGRMAIGCMSDWMRGSIGVRGDERCAAHAGSELAFISARTLHKEPLSRPLTELHAGGSRPSERGGSIAATLQRVNAAHASDSPWKRARSPWKRARKRTVRGSGRGTVRRSFATPALRAPAYPVAPEWLRSVRRRRA